MATAEEYANWIVANKDKRGTPEFETVSQAYQLAKSNPTMQKSDPTEGMTGFDKFAAGAGKAMVDTGRGIGQLFGAVSRKDIEESRARDAALMDTGAGFVGNIGGNLAMALAPGAALKYGGVAMNAPRAIAAGSAMMAPTTIPTALGVGAAQGFIQPSTSTGETVANTGFGAVASAAVPTALALARTTKAAAEPFYKEGQDRIIGRLLQKAAGGEAKDVAARIASAGEIVPGSVPTLAQAAQNPGIGALERTLSATNPEVGLAIKKQLDAQNAARVEKLTELAGTSGARDFHAGMREEAADTLYKKAYEAGIDLKRNAETGQYLTKQQWAARKGEITKLMETPAMQEAAQRARQLMLNDPNLKGKVLDSAGSVQGLDYTRRALSDMIGDAKGNNEKRILMNLRERLDTTLNTISPKYAEAKSTFAEMSKPINQMDIAQEIADKSINKLTGKLQPQAFARSLSDDTAARATGFKAASLEKTMTPEQLQMLNAIKADLARAQAAENVGRGVGSDTIQKLAYSNMVDAAGIPSFIRNMAGPQIAGNILSRGGDAIYGRANREMAARLADSVSNPKRIADLLQASTETPNIPLSALLGRLGAAGALALPATVNAKKQ